MFSVGKTKKENIGLHKIKQAVLAYVSKKLVMSCR